MQAEVAITPTRTDGGVNFSASVICGKSKAMRFGFPSQEEAKKWVAEIKPKVELTFDSQISKEESLPHNSYSKREYTSRD